MLNSVFTAWIFHLTNLEEFAIAFCASIYSFVMTSYCWHSNIYNNICKATSTITSLYLMFNNNSYYYYVEYIKGNTTDDKTQGFFGSG